MIRQIVTKLFTVEIYVCLQARVFVVSKLFQASASKTETYYSLAPFKCSSLW